MDPPYVTNLVPNLESRVRAVASRWRHDPAHLLQVLREVQEDCGYVPPHAITLVARFLRLPYSRVSGVASFYSFLATEPRGEYRILFSDNITDRMQGNEELIDALCRQLWAEPGKVAGDGLVSVSRTSCIGMCDQGPALLVNGRTIPSLTGERIKAIGDRVLARSPLAEWPAEWFVVQDNVRRADILLAQSLRPGDAIRAALQRGARGRSERPANERSWR